MSQIGETINVGDVIGREASCPFDHELAKPPKVHNEFEGLGTTLAQNMAGGVSTYLFDPFKPSPPPPLVLSPNVRPGHRFAGGSEAVVVPYSIPGSRKKEAHTYPVTCAAHHLIPAQESLKRAEGLHEFMVKGSEPMKGGSAKGSTVWSDVGYNVNGSENGMFLPGNYAVGGGVGGSRQWTAAPSVLAEFDEDDEDWDENDDHDEEAVVVPKSSKSSKLTGNRHQIDPENRKWLYVSQAVQMCPGQFHDRHKKYSDFVLSVLEAIADEYSTRLEAIENKAGCKKCQDRRAKQKDEGMPTPYKLVGRLNGVSKRLNEHLGGHSWKKMIYTSRWGLAYMMHMRK